MTIADWELAAFHNKVKSKAGFPDKETGISWLQGLAQSANAPAAAAAAAALPPEAVEAAAPPPEGVEAAAEVAPEAAEPPPEAAAPGVAEVIGTDSNSGRNTKTDSSRLNPRIVE